MLTLEDCYTHYEWDFLIQKRERILQASPHSFRPHKKTSIENFLAPFFIFLSQLLKMYVSYNVVRIYAELNLLIVPMPAVQSARFPPSDLPFLPGRVLKMIHNVTQTL